MTPSQTKLMEQCRREAEAKYLAPHDEDPSWHEEYIIEDIIRCERSAYAQALYDERSKAKTYSMSKDYDALYDIAKSGEYVLGWMVFPKHKVSALIKWFDPVMHIGNTVMHDDKELFKAECTRLNLEWLAPSAGLTVERAMEVVKAWHNYSDLSPKEAENLMMNETPEEAYEDLRARFTAVIQAKR